VAQGMRAARNTLLADRRALIVALLLGAVAAGLVVAYVRSRETTTVTVQPTIPTVSVVVALQNIDAGVTITEAMVDVRPIPRELALAGAITAPADVVGQVARYPVLAGEQVTSERIVGRSSARTLSVQIPQGLRGFTIPVSTNTTPAGVLVPGDFVDILITGPVRVFDLSGTGVSAASGETRGVVTLLQNVQVLAVEREYVNTGVPYDSSTRGSLPEDGRVSYITLALTLEQVQVLWLASQEGSITLALRPFGDEEVVDLSPIAEPVRLR
jgi:pilus assembly protein CpaB